MFDTYIKIPTILFNENKVCDNAKILYGFIWLFSLKDGYCYASNNYLGKIINVSERTITRLILELKNASYITVKYNGRKRYISTNLIDINDYDGGC